MNKIIIGAFVGFMVTVIALHEFLYYMNMYF